MIQRSRPTLTRPFGLRRAHVVGCACEKLEHRTLLSTIVWTNRVVSDARGESGLPGRSTLRA